MSNSSKKSNSDPMVHPDPTAQEERRFWLDKGRELVDKSPDTLHEVAKQVTSISSILADLYFSGIALSGLHGKVKDITLLIIYLSPLASILFSIVMSLFAIFPSIYRIISEK